MLRSNNVNITGSRRLPSPGEVRSELPLSYDAVMKVINWRKEICAILDGKDDRLIVVVGPCSIHDPEAALEYARRLKGLSDVVSDRLLLVMRTYFEKPRTTVGWKGLIYDPDMNGDYDIERGIYLARKILLQVIDQGLPTATEMLDTVIAQYIADAVCWSAIGARTTESQIHRQMSSGLSMPVGFKNATDGSFQIAIDAIKTAQSQHSFIGVMDNDGKVGVFTTKGNQYGHIVLRGGEHPNYEAEYIAFLKVAMRRNNLKSNIIVDCSHANSNKDFRKQHKVFEDVIRQMIAGETSIKGVMLESYLCEGQQKLIEGSKPASDISVTDGCIGWEETERLICEAYEKLKEAKR